MIRNPQNGLLEPLTKRVSRRKSLPKHKFLLPWTDTLYLKFDARGNFEYYFLPLYKIRIFANDILGALLFPDRIVHQYDKKIYLSDIRITRRRQPRLVGTWELKPHEILLIHLKRIVIYKSILKETV